MTPVGIRFEDMVIERLEDSAGYGVAGREQDRYQGTDFYFHRVPVDVTINHKKRGVHWGERIDLHIASVTVGVRVGNGHHGFEHPVMVLLFEPNTGARLPVHVERQLHQHMAREVNAALISDAIDLFWQLVDTLEEQEVI